MIENSEEHKRRSTKPNWVDVSTLFVLTATLMAVIVYACEAHKQNTLTGKVVEIETRPYVGAGFDRPHPSPHLGDKLTFHVIAIDFGRRPATARIKAAVIYSLDVLPTVDLTNAWTDQQLIWPGWPSGFNIYSSPLTTGQIDDMKAGQGHIYVRVVIDYGPYKTDICSSMSLTQSATDMVIINAPDLCSGLKNNCTDEGCK